MSHRNAVVRQGTLCWKEEDIECELVVGTKDWYNWLQHSTSFLFADERSSYTARKERGARGGWYWRAYQWQTGKLRRVYLGKSEALSLPRLVEVMQALSQQKSQSQRDHAIKQSRESVTRNLILQTKVSIPPHVAALVERPRLSKRLRQICSIPLTVISATAGSGKTTLISQWALQSPLPVAWVSLDAQDNDPFRFWTYLFSALDQVEHGLCAQAQELLRSAEVSIEIILTIVLNAMRKSTREIVLVCDDYHFILKQEIQQGMLFLLEHLQLSMHLVLISRHEPSLPLARLRARGQLLELHSDDLCFTLEECEAFLRDVMSLELSTKEVVVLLTRSEGWITGLQLAALTLRNSPEENFGSPKPLGGQQRFVFDYLVQEVFTQQPEEIQQFLLKTAILDRLTVSLCEAVIEEQNVREMLERIELCNLFLIPLDNRRHWYRYHALFAEFLLTYMQQMHADMLPVLHQRASYWYEAHDMLSEAIDHAFAAHDEQRLVALIEPYAYDLILHRGQSGVLSSLLNRLPHHLIRLHPRLSLVRALFQTMSSSADVESSLRDAETGFLAAPLEEHVYLRAAIDTMWAYIKLQRGESIQARQLAHHALEMLPEHEYYWRRIAEEIVITSVYIQGEMVEADRLYRRHIVALQATGDQANVITATFNLGHMHQLAGHLRQAMTLYRQTLHLTMRADILDSSMQGYAYAFAGMIYYEWNEWHKAEHYFHSALECGEETGNVHILNAGYKGLIRLRQAQEAKEQVQDLLTEAEQVIREFHNAEIIDNFAAFQIEIWIMQGRLKETMGWLGEAKLALDEPAFWHPNRQYEQLILAGLQLALHRSQEAIHILKQLRQTLEVNASWMKVYHVKLLVLLAYAFYDQGAQMLAQQTLISALRYAEPEGYIRTFLDQGDTLLTLLAQLSAANDSSVPMSYVQSILNASRQNVYNNQSFQEVQPVPISLSTRELSVLRLIGEGYTDNEVAQHLVIAVSTVRTYIKRIYEKLHVHNRIQAVIRAKEMRLLVG